MRAAGGLFAQLLSSCLAAAEVAWCQVALCAALNAACPTALSHSIRPTQHCHPANPPQHGRIMAAGSSAPLRRLHLFGRDQYRQPASRGAVPSVLRVPRLAGLRALKLSATALHGTLKDLLLAVPTSLSCLEVAFVTYPGSPGGGALAPESAAQLPSDANGWPASTRAWGRLARLERLSLTAVQADGDERCRGGSLDKEASQRIWFPAHVSMLTSLRDLRCYFTACGRDGDSAGLSADLLLPAGLARLDLHVSTDWEWREQPVYKITGPAALTHAHLDMSGAGVEAWDLSAVHLCALTSLKLEVRFTHGPPVPAWLPGCTALRELRLRCLFHGAGPSDAAAPLPPRALAGLASLELLGVTRCWRLGFYEMTRGGRRCGPSRWQAARRACPLRRSSNSLSRTRRARAAERMHAAAAPCSRGCLNACLGPGARLRQVPRVKHQWHRGRDPAHLLHLLCCWGPRVHTGRAHRWRAQATGQSTLPALCVATARCSFTLVFTSRFQAPPPGWVWEASIHAIGNRRRNSRRLASPHGPSPRHMRALRSALQTLAARPLASCALR